MENFWKLWDLINHHFKSTTTSDYEVVFRTEDGDYTILDLMVDNEAKKTVFLLLEYGK